LSTFGLRRGKEAETYRWTRGKSVCGVKPTSVLASFVSDPGGRYFVTTG
jgi:hypothetical protein